MKKKQGKCLLREIIIPTMVASQDPDFVA
jgi:hypothetical protein